MRQLPRDQRPEGSSERVLIAVAVVGALGDQALDLAYARERGPGSSRGRREGACRGRRREWAARWKARSANVAGRGRRRERSPAVVVTRSDRTRGPGCLERPTGIVDGERAPPVRNRVAQPQTPGAPARCAGGDDRECRDLPGAKCEHRPRRSLGIPSIVGVHRPRRHRIEVDDQPSSGGATGTDAANPRAAHRRAPPRDVDIGPVDDHGAIREPLDGHREDGLRVRSAEATHPAASGATTPAGDAGPRWRW
jgi:hypothetical protein